MKYPQRPASASKLLAPGNSTFGNPPWRPVCTVVQNRVDPSVRITQSSPASCADKSSTPASHPQTLPTTKCCSKIAKFSTNPFGETGEENSLCPNCLARGRLPHRRNSKSMGCTEVTNLLRCSEQAFLV
jgi:hypothetical protein